MNWAAFCASSFDLFTWQNAFNTFNIHLSIANRIISHANVMEQISQQCWTGGIVSSFNSIRIVSMQTTFISISISISILIRILCPPSLTDFFPLFFHPLYLFMFYSRSIVFFGAHSLYFFFHSLDSLNCDFFLSQNETKRKTSRNRVEENKKKIRTGEWLTSSGRHQFEKFAAKKKENRTPNGIVIERHRYGTHEHNNIEPNKYITFYQWVCLRIELATFGIIFFLFHFVDWICVCCSSHWFLSIFVLFEWSFFFLFSIPSFVLAIFGIGLLSSLPLLQQAHEIKDFKHIPFGCVYVCASITFAPLWLSTFHFSKL